MTLRYNSRFKIAVHEPFHGFDPAHVSGALLEKVTGVIAIQDRLAAQRFQERAVSADQGERVPSHTVMTAGNGYRAFRVGFMHHELDDRRGADAQVKHFASGTEQTGYHGMLNHRTGVAGIATHQHSAPVGVSGEGGTEIDNVNRAEGFAHIPAHSKTGQAQCVHDKLMTTAALLGDTPSKHSSGSFTIDERSITCPDYWEYNFTAGGMSFATLHGAAHPKAYVVAFDTNGHLFSWREPLATNVYKLVQNPEQSN